MYDVRRWGAAVLVVASGGALGALARVTLGAVSRNVGPPEPWPTLNVNVVGAVAIGAVMVLLLARYPDALLARLFLVTGVLGGFTTFSALTVETVDLMRLDRA
jgi:CrcB protein